MAFKPVSFSRHAKHRMRRQNIDPSVVIATIRAPERETPTVKGRLNRWGQIGRRVLRVTCMEERKQIVVVSVFFMRRTKRAGR
jgi:hypothetical protein